MQPASYSQMSSGPADKAMHAAKMPSVPADKHFIRRSGLIRRTICLPMIQYLSAGQRCLTRMRRSRSDEALAITQEGGGGRNDDDDDAEAALHCRNSAFRPTSSSMVCMLRKLTDPIINLSPIFYCLIGGAAIPLMGACGIRSHGQSKDRHPLTVIHLGAHPRNDDDSKAALLG